MQTEDMKTFLNSLSGVIENDKIELFNKIIDDSNIKSFEDPEDFFYAVLYPWEKFIGGYIKNTISTNRNVEFIYENSQFIDSHFKNLFVKYEGSACSADKSRTIVRRLLDFYLNGNKIDFNYDQEYTYHLPEKIFKEHQDIVDFYEGLVSLKYGNPEKYLISLNKVVTNGREN